MSKPETEGRRGSWLRRHWKGALTGAAILLGLGASMGFISIKTKQKHDGALTLEHLWGDKKPGATVLLMRVEGPITTSEVKGVSKLVSSSGFANAYGVQETLEKAAKDERVRAVVVQFATPGGTVSGARAIHYGIQAVKAAGKPVVAHVDGMSASGGVYAMCSADEILAEHGSMVGSIGVTLGTHHTYRGATAIRGFGGAGVETEHGIQARTYSAGRSKDILSPWREPTEEEVDAIGDLLANQYQHFVEHVSTHRNLTPDKIVSDMGALLFDPEQAKAKGLIDGISGRRGAVEAAAKRAGLEEGRYGVSEPTGEKKGLLKVLLTGGVPVRAPETEAKPAMLGVLAYWQFGDR